MIVPWLCSYSPHYRLLISRFISNSTLTRAYDYYFSFMLLLIFKYPPLNKWLFFPKILQIIYQKNYIIEINNVRGERSCALSDQ